MKTIEFTVNEVIVDGITYIKAEAKKPEFKVGQWVIKSSDNVVVRIKSISDERITYDNELIHYEWQGYIRPATPQEIESHLRKICDEKYIGKTVVCLMVDKWPDIPFQKVVDFSEYNKTEDQLSYYDDEERAVFLYKQGKWAEIIPDKKKLSISRKSARFIIQEFCKYIERDGLSSQINDFLNEYED